MTTRYTDFSVYEGCKTYMDVSSVKIQNIPMKRHNIFSQIFLNEKLSL